MDRKVERNCGTIAAWRGVSGQVAGGERLRTFLVFPSFRLIMSAWINTCFVDLWEVLCRCPAHIGDRAVCAARHAISKLHDGAVGPRRLGPIEGRECSRVV